MSYDRSGKKRCIVKKLNFEDCVVTSLKRRGRKKTRLRATVCREVEAADAEGKNARRDFDNFKSPDTGSPILASKCGRSFRQAKDFDNFESLELNDSVTSKIPSPVLTSDEKRKRLEFLAKRLREVSPKRDGFTLQRQNEPEGIKMPNSNSPILSQKFSRSKPLFSVPAKKKLIMPCSPVLSAKRKRKCQVETVGRGESDLFISPDSFTFTLAGPSDNEEKGSGDYCIESATSEEPQRSPSPEIESCSQSSSDYKPHLPAVGFKTPEKNQTEETDSKNLDSGKKKKRFKKDSLCARLEILNKRSVSERRIWEHEKKIMKIERTTKIILSVVSFWREATRFVLKCRSVDELQLLENDLDSSVILIVDGDLVNDVCKVKDNSVISVSPPWQKLVLSKLNCTVLLSIVCLEILNQNTLPVNRKIFKSEIINDECKLSQRFLIDCLFSL